jgi:rhodanese-related sulfurtransferase
LIVLLKGASVTISDKRYAGDITPSAAYQALRSDKGAVLIDVRSRAEWSYVGTPDLSALGKKVAFVEWQTFPGMVPNSDFVDQAMSELSALGAGEETAIFCLCRSGARSLAAAVALTAAGFTRCFNVSSGFEGPLDQEAHRGAVSGWKAEDLPWIQN